MTNVTPQQTTDNRTSGDQKTRPSHRITFARIIGQDENGKDILGPAREIGAIWRRTNGKKGGILKLDHVPTELTQHQGVIFTLPVDPDYKRQQPQQPSQAPQVTPV